MNMSVALVLLVVLLLLSSLLLGIVMVSCLISDIINCSVERL